MDYVLYGILDFIVDGYVPIVQEIEEEALALEQALAITVGGLNRSGSVKRGAHD